MHDDETDSDLQGNRTGAAMSENSSFSIAGAEEEAKLRRALKFIYDLASEELPHTKIGTGAEVALRHILRKANEALGIR